MKSSLLTVLPVLGIALSLAKAQSVCNDATMMVRKEWGSLTDNERLDFIQSVQCLMNQPSQIPSGVAPGALNRYDDFVATHINATLRVHTNGPFLLYHRHFGYLFETALREECGFSGALPYFNWALWADDILASPLLDGSATSFGGNGNYTSLDGDSAGCVTTGPFANLEAHFRNFESPIGPDGSYHSNGGIPPSDALLYAPHCLRRNVSTAIFQNSYNQSIIDEVLAQPDIIAFQSRIDIVASSEGANTSSLGIHNGGHNGIGGDMFDFFASPSEPIFYLHHAMVDHVYAQWQTAGPSRLSALNGTDLLKNDPAGTEISLDFVQEFGYLDEPRRLGDLVDITKGPYCYRFDTTV